MAGYLVYDTVGGTAGLRHNCSNLGTQIEEAVLLGRILVVPPPNLHTRHNGGYPVCHEWGRYLDLENSLLEIQYKNGERKTCRCPVVSRDDFQSLQILDTECLRLSGDSPVSDEQNQRYRVIFKTLDGTSGMNRFIIPLNFYYDNRRIAGIGMIFKPSRLVESLAGPVLQALGQDYAAMHIRFIRLERFLYRMKPPALKIVCSLLIGLFIKDLKKLVPQDMPFYCMTNHFGGSYHKYLGKHFTVFTYLRFPELKRLLSQSAEEGVDNYLLMQVEHCILESAGIKISTRDDDGHTLAMRARILAGHKPDCGVTINLVHASRSLLVRILRRSGWL